MRFSQIVCIIIALLHLQSCVRTEDFGTPWSEELVPVVFSVITTGETPQVYLGRTYHPKENKGLLPYPEAVVTMMTEGGNQVQLQRKEPQSQYFEDKTGLLNPKPGELIKLKVQLADREVTAQTAIPADYAHILNAGCIPAPTKPNHSIGWNGFSVLKATITADLHLPADKTFGVFLYVKELTFTGGSEVKSERYTGVDHYVPKDSSTFTLTAQTVTPELKTFMFARTLVTSIDYTFIPDLFLSGSAGVLPQYSNISGGVGLFGARHHFDFKVTIPKAN